MVVAGGERLNRPSRVERYRGEVVAHLSRRDASVKCVSLAQLSELVVTPALETRGIMMVQQVEARKWGLAREKRNCMLLLDFNL